MDSKLEGRVDDLAGVQASGLLAGGLISAAHGEGQAGRPMGPDDLFAVWCLVKPVAMGALVAIAEGAADGLETPVRELSPIAAEARLDPGVTIEHLQSLSLPLDRTGLMEAICREERDLRTQLVAEIAEVGIPVSPGAAFHSEYTLWRLVAECLETLTGRQAGTALNTLLATAGLEMQFSIEPGSLLVGRLVDYFDGPTGSRTVLSHSRSGVLLSTWSMPLGGFTTSAALVHWSTAMFFRDVDAPVTPVGELFPTPRSMERVVGAVQSGDRAAALGLRVSERGELYSLGWLGLSRLAIHPGVRTALAILTNDLACDPKRVEALGEHVIAPSEQ